MHQLPTLILDACPVVLIKSGKNSNISLLSARIGKKECLCCDFEYRVGDISHLKSTFLLNRMALNPHSAKYIAINPQYVQP